MGPFAWLAAWFRAGRLAPDVPLTLWSLGSAPRTRWVLASGQWSMRACGLGARWSMRFPGRRSGEDGRRIWTLELVVAGWAMWVAPCCYLAGEVPAGVGS